MQNHNGNGTAALLARGFAALWTTLIVAAPAGALAASVETVLHAFAGGGDGKTVFAGLTADGEGNLYGTTEGGGASYAGTVFELKRAASAGATWTKTVLYDGTDERPQSGVSGHDANGTLCRLMTQKQTWRVCRWPIRLTQFDPCEGHCRHHQRAAVGVE
jgi:uncharacterized repeat protein (TIGR03803 family)